MEYDPYSDYLTGRGYTSRTALNEDRLNQAPTSPANPNLVLRALLGVAAAGGAGLVVAIAYLIFMKQVMGVARGMDGLALVASLVLFPVAAAAITGFLWLPFALWRNSKGKPPTALAALMIGASMGLFAGFVMAGPGGFKLTGGAPAFNYAFTALGSLGAFIFQLIAGKALQTTGRSS